MRRRPFSRLIVAVDGSAAADRAVQLAIALAGGDAQAELIFAHVIDVARMVARADHQANDYELAFEAAREEARHVLDRCTAAAANAGIFSRTCLRYGRPATEVAALADVFAADLILVGNHHRSRIHRLLNGSVSDGVVRSAGVPVLVVSTSLGPR
jgi:nucleotide-binding universal stress UspA family protein